MTSTSLFNFWILALEPKDAAVQPGFVVPRRMIQVAIIGADLRQCVGQSAMLRPAELASKLPLTDYSYI